MRCLFRILLALIVVLAVYAGTAVVSLKALVAATQRADTAAVMSYVDLPRLRSSLAEQIMRAHFGRIEQTRPVKTIERMAGPTVIDALLAQLLTPDNIAAVLQRGVLPTLEGAGTSPVTIPSLSGAGLERTTRILARLRPKTPVLLQVLLDDKGEAAIRLHFEGTHWKLAGIDLPASALQRLIVGISPK
jgi:hypothetical protein